MEIIEKNINDVLPYENNPRINDNAVDAVAESIKQFGFKQPIVINKDGVIVAGHTRYKAAMRLGLMSVPCVVADDLTEEQIKAYRLVDNKTNELSGWDFTLLDKELEELELNNIDMTNFGFNNIEELDINSLFEDVEETTKKEPKTITCPNCGEVIEL